jgi:hypothetical protein
VRLLAVSPATFDLQRRHRRVPAKSARKDASSMYIGIGTLILIIILIIIFT